MEIRALTLEETAQLLGWAGEEGWNPSPDDAEAFYAADPQGFLGCFVDGELASGISAVTFGDTFGFIGLYITRPHFRGRGYGLKVWTAGMARLSGRTIGLDGVPAQQPNYEKMGFRKAYGSTRWSGRLPVHAADSSISAVISDNLKEIMPFDRNFFPAERAAFLSRWIAGPRAAFIARRDGKISGYIVIRRCPEGFKIGPLFASDSDTALSLLNACGTVAGGETVHLDIPNLQTEFTKELGDSGFESGFETARMYLGPPPKIDMSGIFAVTTLELG